MFTLNNERSTFVDTQEVYDLGVSPALLSMWLTNGLLEVAYKNKTERFFWREKVARLIDQYK